MVRLGALVLFLFCNGAMAEQTVITAYPGDNSFKFVWSGEEAVYRDKTTSLRCSFKDSFDGIDDLAEPYIGKSFACEYSIGILFKQLKKDNNSFILITDKEGKVVASTEVLVEVKNY